MSDPTRDLTAAALIALAAIVPRIVIIGATADAGLFADMIDYHDRARYLFDHGRLYPDAFRVPLYPITMAAAFSTLGPTLDAVRALQCAIFTLVAVLTFVIARGITTRRRAVVAGLIVAWYPALMLYTVYAMAEPLFTLLMLLALWCGIRMDRAPAALAAGLFAGLATLTRQAGVAVIAALVVAAAARVILVHGVRAGAVRALRAATLVAAGVALAMTPWIARNATVFGRWMPLETTGGITFLMANYEDATGRYLLSDWEAVMQRYLGKEPEEFSRSAAGYRIGLEKIRAEPLRIAALVPRRLGYLFDLEGREHRWLYTNQYFGERSPAVVRTIGWTLMLSFPLLVIAALAALAFGPRPETSAERLLLWLFAVALVQQMTVFGDPRFHLPFVPLLAIIAVRPWAGAAARERWRIAAGAVALAALLWWWSGRFPEAAQLLERAAAPGGSRIGLTY